VNHYRVHPANLYNLTSLVILNISKNQLTGNLTGTTDFNIGNMTSLQTLNLSENQLAGNLTPRIGDLGNTLIYLNLSDNLFYGWIPDAICKLTKLTSLFLEKNNFSGSIPSEISDTGKFDDIKFGNE
jgi:Leucine-rich repeat (LRR) protein